MFDAAALKREFPGLADASLHYLDSAATAQMPEVVLNALRRFELEVRANVHEVVHRRARAATDSYQEARARVARFLNASSTEEILLSTLEHHSNLVPWQELAKRHGVVLRFLPMTDDGRLNLDRLETELTDRCRLVAFTHCSNVTGALTDVARVVAAARAVGAKIMLDGAQRAPQGPLDVRRLDVDFYVFSGHKTYGPTGIGVLWGRWELLDAMPPFMTGGQMIEAVTLTSSSFRAPPRRFEAGTPPIAQAIGLGATLDWMQGLDWDAIQAHEERLTRRLIDGLTSLAGVRLLGPVDTRDRRGVVTFSVDGFSADDVCRFLDDRGIALRGGYHCAQPLVRAFGVEGAARASLAPYSIDADVDGLLQGVEDLLRSRYQGASHRHEKPMRAG
jgi:cysteine desulfurase/selenocysteine lyase